MRKHRRGLARAREYSRIIGEARGYRLSAWQWLNKERVLFDPTKKTNKGIILASTAILALVLLSPTPVFHSYLTNPFAGQANALQESCRQWHNPATCATVAAGAMDPSYPVSIYDGSVQSLADFNIAGQASYTTSCGHFNTTKCIQLAAKSPPPSLPILFRQTATLKSLYVTLTPITLASSYKRITMYQNNTVAFDVTGGHGQTITWQITTSQTTTLNWYAASQPASVSCSFCSSSTWNGYAQVLIIHAPVTAQQFTIVFTGANLACLCGLVETVSPIGDLSPAVAKELELQLYWTEASGTLSPTTAPYPNPTTPLDYSWGFFLTTNASLWQTSNNYYSPYKDPSVVLLDSMRTVSVGAYNSMTNILFVQQKPGETLQQEDSGSCTSGSEFICLTGSQEASRQGMMYMDLNFTGSGCIAGGTCAQIGNGVNCPTTSGGSVKPGGPGCSYIAMADCFPPTIGLGCNGETSAANVKLPGFSLTGATYYLGMYVGVAQLGAPILFCFDSGSFCSAQQAWVVSGCVSASMEVDYCVPTPASTNAVSSVTDSGGFFGSALRLLASGGQSLLSLGNSAVGVLTTTLSGPWNALARTLSAAAIQLGTYLFSTVIALVNAIGGIIGLPNLGSNLLSLLQAIVGFFGVYFTDLIANMVQQVSSWITIISGLTGLLGVYFTDFNNWMTGIFNLLSFLWQVAGLMLGIPFAFLFTGWMFYGILRALKSMEAWWDWFHTTGYGVLIGLSISWYLFVLFVNHIIIPIVNTITAMATSEQAVKPDLGGAAIAAA